MIRRCCLRPCWLLGVLIWPHLRSCEGKHISGSVKLGGEKDADHWRYVTKFGFAIGQGTFKVRLRNKAPSMDPTQNATLDFEVFLDEDWDEKVVPNPKCNTGRSGKGRVSAAARQVRRINIPWDKRDWSQWEDGKVRQNIRTHIWLFALSSCANFSTPYEVDYEVELHQFDGSEFSFELRYMLGIHLFVLLTLTVMMARFGVKWSSMRRLTGETHPVIAVLALAVALDWSSQVLHTVHLSWYRGDGQGSPVSEFFAEVFLQLSQVISATLLIAIGQGYTLADMSGKKRQAAVAPIAIAVGIVHILVILLGKMQGESSERFTTHETTIGWVIVAIRFALYCWFQCGLQSLKGQAGMKLEAFLRNFGILGSLYFLAYPVLFFVVQIFAPYLRHPILHVGLFSMQAVAQLWLADLTLNSKSAYHQLSELGNSSLPGGSPLGMGNSPSRTNLTKDD